MIMSDLNCVAAQHRMKSIKSGLQRFSQNLLYIYLHLLSTTLRISGELDIHLNTLDIS